ncbi:MAG: hypothetical protein J0H31_18400 [Alphaproteobacteria bacterium]|nr:hypothetical protein [Alphaproteobacteria bacterium]
MILTSRLSDPTVRRSIEDEIERLIALLDYVEPEPDLEPWLAGGIEVVGMGDREGDDERELDDEREADPADYDCPGYIPGGQGA